MYNCNYCKEEIKNDVAHVNGEAIYHLSCYRKCMQGHDEDLHFLYECPRCHTLGKRWNGEAEGWRPCALCKGTGYLSIDRASTEV